MRTFATLKIQSDLAICFVIGSLDADGRRTTRSLTFVSGLATVGIEVIGIIDGSSRDALRERILFHNLEIKPVVFSSGAGPSI